MTRTRFDRRTLLSVGAIGIAASALGLRAGFAHEGEDHEATPAGGSETAHPAHIHAGTCEELGDVVFPLNDVAALGVDVAPASTPGAMSASSEAGADGTPGAAATAGAGEVVAESITEVEASLDDILAAEHAINVHESAENIQNYIACGDLAGTLDANGSLVVGLGELNDSGYTGIAVLSPSLTEGSTDVSVFIASDLSDGDTDGI